MASRMTLYLPQVVEETLQNVPREGRNVYVQMAVIHYAKSAEGRKVVALLEQGYKPTVKG